MVGVERLDPVQRHRVLPGPLQLQGQGQGYEEEDLLNVVRRLGRVGDAGEERVADERAPGGQLRVGDLLGDGQDFRAQGCRQHSAEVVGQGLVIAEGKGPRLHRCEPRLVAQVRHQLPVRVGLVNRPWWCRWNRDRAQLRQQVDLGIGEDADGGVPGAVAAHPQPLLVEVFLGVGLGRIECQHPRRRRVDRAEHRWLGLQAPGAQGQQHHLQRFQPLLGARGPLPPAVQAVDAELLGQPVGDDRRVPIPGDGGQACLSEQRQGLLGGAHHRLHRLGQRQLLPDP